MPSLHRMPAKSEFVANLRFFCQSNFSNEQYIEYLVRWHFILFWKADSF
jgi:hypothetical protein